MKITISCVGKIKEAYFREAIEEYTKRLKRYVDISINENPDEKAPESLSPLEKEKIKEKEGKRILEGINPSSFVIALDIKGKKLNSEALAEYIEEIKLRGFSHITFVIGGSLGLSEEVLKRADFRLSFSDMTFPHQLMRVILLEQIYRAHRIINNEPYHK